VKLGISAAGPLAPPNAFVTFRDDFCRTVERAARLGYDGVELALRAPDEVDLRELRACLAATGMEIPCISTGQVFATDGLYFTHPDASVRQAALERLIGMIHLAAELGAMVNTGRVRGFVHDLESPETAAARYVECLHRLADIAEPAGVTLVIEPVNRYEINFINSCSEALAILREAGRPCVKLLPDLFHMNIEDVSYRDSLEAARDEIAYVHIADSNRLAPGWGHLPFDGIFKVLADIGYDGYLTCEILPKPGPEDAAAQAVAYLRRQGYGIRSVRN
jgi:sugar phosphate isomerase/epimerase